MRLTYMIATLAGIGGRVIAPGTVGSLLAVFPSVLVLYFLGVQGLSFFVAALFFAGYWAVDAELKIRYKSSPQLSMIPYDPQDIIIDEVIGQAMAISAVVEVWDIPLAFLLFRVFDIVKPWPICVLEKRVTGAAGIILDDMIAGSFAYLVLTALHVVLPLVQKLL